MAKKLDQHDNEATNRPAVETTQEEILEIDNKFAGNIDPEDPNAGHYISIRTKENTGLLNIPSTLVEDLSQLVGAKVTLEWRQPDNGGPKFGSVRDIKPRNTDA